MDALILLAGLHSAIQPIAAEDDSDTLAVEGQANTTHHQ